jgi:hypothetical protein
VLAVQLVGALLTFGFALRPDRNPPPQQSQTGTLSDERIPEPVV